MVSSIRGRSSLQRHRCTAGRSSSVTARSSKSGAQLHLDRQLRRRCDCFTCCASGRAAGDVPIMKRFLKALATFSLIETIGRQPAVAARHDADRPRRRGWHRGSDHADDHAAGVFHFRHDSGMGRQQQRPSAERRNCGSRLRFQAQTRAALLFMPRRLLTQGPGQQEFALGDNSQGLCIEQPYPAGHLDCIGFWNGDQVPSVVACEQPLTALRRCRAAPDMRTDITHSRRRGAAVRANRLAVWSQSVTGGFWSQRRELSIHGFMCSTTPTINTASIPTDRRAGSDWPGSVDVAATSCAVVSVGGVNQAQVTAHVTVAHGVTPGLTYTMQGFKAAPARALLATTARIPRLPGLRVRRSLERPAPQAARPRQSILQAMKEPRLAGRAARSRYLR